MIVAVYHKDRETGGFELVAMVASMWSSSPEHALEFAYRWTNSVGGSWSKGPFIDCGDDVTRPNPDWSEYVTVEAPLPVYNGRKYGLRSSSVDDEFEVQGHGRYRCASFGFEKIEVAA